MSENLSGCEHIRSVEREDQNFHSPCSSSLYLWKKCSPHAIFCDIVSCDRVTVFAWTVLFSSCQDWEILAAIQIKDCVPKITSLRLNHILYACKKLSLQKTVRVPRPLLYSCNLASNPFQPAEAEQLGLRCNITMQHCQSQGLNKTVEFREGVNWKKTVSFGHCPNYGGGSTHARIFWTSF